MDKDQVKGKVNETAGKATGDDSQELKGKLQQEAGKIKEKAEDLKDDVAGEINKLFDKKDKK
ncbi:hypothetical protein EsVE80_19010 [Enterococcus saigonensis]|uniref:CsbD-like domain-containing protein n=1 Tax=Enterococcus saigonensis TaxID=1805431 RepID=A0A679I9Q0_9ENTE|nr:CsbD family protein [Enterococcus saigonensis]BCA86378.1 hypothetical protein EsVE80_19010 [Enterococcus saigonensis]